RRGVNLGLRTGEIGYQRFVRRRKGVTESCETGGTLRKASHEGLRRLELNQPRFEMLKTRSQRQPGMPEMKNRMGSWVGAARSWMQRPRPAKPVQAPKPPFWALLDLVREPALAVLFAFVATTAIAQPFYVPSGSMEPTLQIGDALIATKYDYGYSR